MPVSARPQGDDDAGPFRLPSSEHLLLWSWPTAASTQPPRVPPPFHRSQWHLDNNYKRLLVSDSSPSQHAQRLKPTPTLRHHCAPAGGGHVQVLRCPALPGQNGTPRSRRLEGKRGEEEGQKGEEEKGDRRARERRARQASQSVAQTRYESTSHTSIQCEVERAPQASGTASAAHYGLTTTPTGAVRTASAASAILWLAAMFSHEHFPRTRFRCRVPSGQSSGSESEARQVPGRDDQRDGESSG
jgi:hypothetical protein